MDWNDMRRNYLTILSDEGFRPVIDDDGDIHFKYEGGNYFITSNCDDSYLYILYPRFWSIDSRQELMNALVAANSANTRVKAAKVYVHSSGDNVSTTLECLFANLNDTRQFIGRGLRCMQLAVEIFREEMRKNN